MLRLTQRVCSCARRVATTNTVRFIKPEQPRRFFHVTKPVYTFTAEQKEKIRDEVMNDWNNDIEALFARTNIMSKLYDENSTPEELSTIWGGEEMGKIKEELLQMFGVYKKRLVEKTGDAEFAESVMKGIIKEMSPGQEEGDTTTTPIRQLSEKESAELLEGILSGDVEFSEIIFSQMTAEDQGKYLQELRQAMVEFEKQKKQERELTDELGYKPFSENLSQVDSKLEQLVQKTRTQDEDDTTPITSTPTKQDSRLELSEYHFNKLKQSMYKYQNKQLRRKITKEAMDQARRGEKRVLKSDRVIRYHIGDADKYTDKEEEEDSDVDSDDEKSEETDYESEVEEKSATKEVVLPQNIKDKTDKWLTSTFNAKEVFAQDRAQKEAKLALDVRSSYMRTLAKMGLQEHEMKQYAQLIQNKHKKMLEIEGAARAQLVGGSALALIEGKPSRKKKKAQEQEKKEFNEMKHERVTVDTLRQDHFEDLGKNRLRWARKIGDALKETLVYDNTNHALRDVEIKYVEMNESLRVASVKWEPNSITEWKFEQYERVNKLLNQAAGFLASRVAARTKVRNAPKFEFYYDLEPEAASEYIVQAADPNSGHAQYEQLNALLKRLGAKQDKEEDAQVEEWIFRTYEMGDDQKEMSRKVSIEERNRRIEQSQKQKVINRRKRRSKAK